MQKLSFSRKREREKGKRKRKSSFSLVSKKGMSDNKLPWRDVTKEERGVQSGLIPQKLRYSLGWQRDCSMKWAKLLRGRNVDTTVEIRAERSFQGGMLHISSASLLQWKVKICLQSWLEDGQSSPGRMSIPSVSLFASSFSAVWLLMSRFHSCEDCMSFPHWYNMGRVIPLLSSNSG